MEEIATRIAYGKALQKLGREDPKIVALDADVSCCTMSEYFAEEFPERFFNVGIAEANMVGMAAGLATTGKTVFVHTFAMFAAGRVYDQVRNSLCYPGLNVKVVGTHAGLTIGEDGATHQCIEDLALMRAIPHMVVVCPCDGYETEQAARAIAAYQGPCYLRLGRLAVATVTEQAPGYHFELGKGVVLRDGTDLTIVGTGLMVQEALKAAEALASEGISARVVDMHTIKPIDEELLLRCARETGAIVTTEEHNVLAGLGGAVSEVVSSGCPVPVIRHGVMDEFGKSGTPAALMERYHMLPADICACAKRALALKH